MARYANIAEALRDPDSNLAKTVRRADEEREKITARVDELVAQGRTPEQAWQHVLTQEVSSA